MAELRHRIRHGVPVIISSADGEEPCGDETLEHRRLQLTHLRVVLGTNMVVE
jgi:hypothetical protein